MAPNSILLYTDGSKSTSQISGSGWTIYQKISNHISHEIASGYCCIGDKAEVYDAELHAIQEGLLHVLSKDWNTTNILIYVDNQAALTTLTTGNPDGSEFAHHTLQSMTQLQQQDWTVSGFWTPAHCGITGNERADVLAKKGTQYTSVCTHTRVTKSWLQAKLRQQLIANWLNQHPRDDSFPIEPSTTFPKELRNYSPNSIRALFRLQSTTTPSDPFPNELAGKCFCGEERTSKHLLESCPYLKEA